MRYFIVLLAMTLFSCGAHKSENAQDSTQAAAVLQSDSAQYGEEPDWLEVIDGNTQEMVDSIGFCDAALYSWLLDGNYRAVALNYTVSGERKFFLLTDTLPGYWNTTYSHEVVQINGTGGEEIVVRVSSWRLHGGAGVTTTEDMQQDVFFVFEPGTNRLLFSGTNVSQAINYCGSGSGSDCEDFETGYSYKVHFEPGAIILDSLDLLGETNATALDHRLGKYRWLDGMFINLD